MSKDLIAKARKLSASACEGPWRHCCANSEAGCGGVMVWDESDEENPVVRAGKEHVNAKGNLAFIAESRTLMPALADLADSAGRRAEEAERELMKIRQAWEAEHSMGGVEPEPALTCMLQALKTLREQKQGMENGFRALIAERDAALAELAKIKGQHP